MLMTIDRRAMIAGAALAGLAASATAQTAPPATGGALPPGLPEPTETIDLWPAGAPGAPATPLVETVNERSTDAQITERAVFGISRSRMTLLRPDRPNGAGRCAASDAGADGGAGLAFHRPAGQMGQMGRLITAGRMAWLLARFGGGRLMQPSTMTSANRHPELFDHVRQALADVAVPSILSFGCSTGEEVFTLAAMMPDAFVRGIDINAACIQQARQRLSDAEKARLSFACTASAAGEPTAHYDAIFALSVLRHGRLDAEQPDDCSAILPFARFARSIADLDRCLKPGGLLVIWGSHFRLSDTPVKPRYTVELAMPYRAAQPVYGADNRRLADPGMQQIVFRKQSEVGIITPIQ